MVFEFTSAMEEAADPITFQEIFYERGWTDGLPVVPPTPERVSEFLEYSGYGPADVITMVPTRNRVITAEKVAINCVMAGCLPAYMPVVVAILQAMSVPAYLFHASITSTGGSAQFVVVNGPIRHQLKMNSGVNVFGPGNRANTTIGRAIRLIIINVAGAVPGILDKSTQGHPGKYSFTMAEDEENSPWEPLNVEWGMGEFSTVTVHAAESPHGIQNHLSGDPEELLTCIAREVASVGGFSQGQSALVLSPEHAHIIAKGGFTKKQVKQFLYDHSCHTKADLKRWGKIGGQVLKEDETKLVKRGLGPDDILLVVAGGSAGGHSAFIPSWSRSRASHFQMKPIGDCLDCKPHLVPIIEKHPMEGED
jgi:hypothetical protein